MRAGLKSRLSGLQSPGAFLSRRLLQHRLCHFHSHEPTRSLSPLFPEKVRLGSLAKDPAWLRAGGRAASRSGQAGAEAAGGPSSPPRSSAGLPPFRPQPRTAPARTTFPDRTRARARAPGPPPWRQCCPGRSSSRVRSRSLATTPPRRAWGDREARLWGAKSVGAWPQPPTPKPGGAAGARRRAAQSRWAGRSGARRVGIAGAGRASGLSQGGAAGGRGQVAGAAGAAAAAMSQRRRRSARGASGQGRRGAHPSRAGRGAPSRRRLPAGAAPERGGG